MMPDASISQPTPSYYHDPSFQRSGRIHRTHTDANKANIAKMSWRSKLIFNSEVEGRNEERRARRLIRDDVSDVESFLSFDEEEVFKEMQKNSSYWDDFKKFLPTSLQTLFSRRMLQKTGPIDQSSINNPAAPVTSATPVTRRPKPDFTPLNRDDMNSRHLPSFPSQLFQLADHDFLIPLSWFTTKNQRWLASNMHTFKFLPLTHIASDLCVLDTEDVSEKMELSLDAGPSKDEDLCYSEWRTAIDNLLQFEVAVYQNEGAARPVFLAEHSRFFDKPDAEESFPFWIGMETRLRREHYLYRVAFDRMTYVTDYSHCYKAWKDSMDTCPTGRVPSSVSFPDSRYQPYPNSSKTARSSGCRYTDNSE
ncbi:hypothetical protein F5878DRAFT_628680 [Lentinula raphanica]|uniref:Uncharacterized protein n=1 Tax=Lentinula raphanica TaxID=153919 RepID=A0AA38P2M0_9AGAR|nr:hypothetical protein F5878DRAFT_628680 [Lentinula raphanica]